MAKLVLFLQTDILLREKHTSTSLVEAFFLVHSQNLLCHFHSTSFLSNGIFLGSPRLPSMK